MQADSLHVIVLSLDNLATINIANEAIGWVDYYDRFVLNPLGQLMHNRIH